MNKSKIIIVVLFFVGLTAFGQENTVTGTIKDAKPYNDQYMVTVGNTSFVLIRDMKDQSKTNFEINDEYKDILIKHKGKYEINPKYSKKTFKVTYYINGKGWKCIKTIEPIK